MDAVNDDWDFTPTRDYEKAGGLTTMVERQDNEGWVRPREVKTTMYMDSATGIIVADREKFEAFIAPLEALLRRGESVRDDEVGA
jgi:hypothetical protein